MFRFSEQCNYIPKIRTCQGVIRIFSKELFGQRLCEVRLRHHESQTELGKAIGVVKSRISEIESGKNTTTAEKIALICEHYNISSDYLLGLSDEPEPKDRQQAAD